MDEWHFAAFRLWVEKGWNVESIAQETGKCGLTIRRALAGRTESSREAMKRWEKEGNPPVRFPDGMRIDIGKQRKAIEIMHWLMSEKSATAACARFGVCHKTITEMIRGGIPTYAEAARLFREETGRMPHCYKGSALTERELASVAPARHQGSDLEGYVACPTGRVGRLLEDGSVVWLSSDTTSETQPYPIINCAGKTRTLHSVVGETFLGDRPEGYDIMHLNHDTTDCRVENLAYATTRQNMQESLKDGRLDGRYRKPIGDERALEIFSMRERKVPMHKIAATLGISITTCHNILHGKMRPHLRRKWDERKKSLD